MPAISAGNASIIRYEGGAIDPCYLLIPPLTIAGTALVNGAPDYDDPVYEIAIDNASVDFETNTDRGAIVHISDPVTGALKYVGVARRAPTATTLYTEAMREGDTGTAQLFGQSIADNDLVTVYVQHGIGASLSHLDLDTSTLYKRRDLPFDTAYPPSQYPEVHARIGDHRHARVASGASASLTFVDNSYDFIAQTLERTWHPPAGWTQTTGTSTSATAIYDVPAGNYLIEMTAARVGGTEATDSNRAFRYVFVTDGPGGDNPAFSDLFAVTPEPSEQNRTGRTMTFLIRCNDGDETTLLTYLYPGAFCLFQETPRHSDDNWATESAASAGEVDHFAGHLRRYEQVDVDANGVQTWRVTFESWLVYAGAVKMPTQVFRVATAPDEWYEMHPDCADVGCMMWMWIFYHSDVGRFYDIFFEDVRDFHTPRTSVDRGTLLGSLQQIMELITNANIGCVSSGALYARRHGSFEPDATRDAIATVWTWAAGDIVPGLAVARDPLMKVGQLRGAGIVSTTSDTTYGAFAAEFGYLAPAQAPGRPDMQSFIATSPADVDARVGHKWQHMNRPVEYIPAQVLGVRDVIDPALMEWHVLDLGDYAVLETDAFSTTRRVLPLSVSRTYRMTPVGMVKETRVQFEPETKGKAATRVRQLNTGTMEPGAVLGDRITTLPPAVPTPQTFDPCTDGAHPETDHCYSWDFTTSDGGWSASLFGGTVSEWESGVGWKSALRTVGFDQTDELRVGLAFTSSFSRSLQWIEIEAEFTLGQIQFSGSGRGNFVIRDTSTSTTMFSQSGSFDGTVLDSTPPASNTMRSGFEIIAIASQRTSGTPSPRGVVALRRLSVGYNGDDANFSGGSGS